MAPMTASRRLTPGTRPARLARRPAHTSGRVMLSGSSCVSKSMNVSAISDQSSRHAATAMSVGPKRKTAAAVTAPVSSSTSGYRAEVGAWLAGELGALRAPTAIEHLREAVDDDVQEAANAQPDQPGDGHRDQRRHRYHRHTRKRDSVR